MSDKIKLSLLIVKILDFKVTANWIFILTKVINIDITKIKVGFLIAKNVSLKNSFFNYKSSKLFNLNYKLANFNFFITIKNIDKINSKN